jgi:hypothetical protein
LNDLLAAAGPALKRYQAARWNTGEAITLARLVRSMTFVAALENSVDNLPPPRFDLPEHIE